MPAHAPIQIEIAKDISRFYHDPLGFVMYAFPWDTDASIQMVELQSPYKERFNCKYGPDLWACEFLDEIGRQTKVNKFDGRNAVRPLQFAVSSGHGIGKSTMTAWLVLWIMSTRPYCRGTITANTADQLRTKTWAEVGKWLQKAINRDWFGYSNTKGNMRIFQNESPNDWRADAITCREENSEAFAGQHAANSTSFYINDEASAIPEKIWEVQEGGLTDGEPMRFAFGNPTRNTGSFRECFRRFVGRWTVRTIDSREVAITNKTQIEAQVQDYGEDSDFVKVRVRGVFPSQSMRQFISEDDVRGAFGRHLREPEYSFAPVIITCDPAWTGNDSLVISKRQGLHFEILHVLPRNDNDVEVAYLLAKLENDCDAQAVIIDMGWGTGIYSAGRTMGRSWHLINFAQKSPDIGCLNMRAYMWKQARDWLKQGGAIPLDNELFYELTAPETVPRLDGKIQLESKEDMKRRGLASPNKADSLALSFAIPLHSVAKRDIALEMLDRKRTVDYDPWADD